MFELKTCNVHYCQDIWHLVIVVSYGFLLRCFMKDRVVLALIGALDLRARGEGRRSIYALISF